MQNLGDVDLVILWLLMVVVVGNKVRFARSVLIE